MRTQHKIKGGSFPEYLTFSLDCQNVQPTDPKLQRLADGSFEILDTADFTVAGKYFFWFKPPYIEYEGYVIASESYWVVSEPPKINIVSSLTYFLNLKVEQMFLLNVYNIVQEFQLFTGSPDWMAGNEINAQYIQFDIDGYIHIWFPETS